MSVLARAISLGIAQVSAARAAAAQGAAAQVAAVLAARPTVPAAPKGKYKGQWTFKWHVWRRFLDVEVSSVVRKIEAKLYEKLKQQKGVVSIESVSTTIERTWHEYVLGIYHGHAQGATVTVFTTNSPPQAKSPLFGIDDTIIIVSIIAIIALIVGYTLVKISSDIKDVTEKVPAIVPAAAAVGLGAIALVGLLAYLYMKRKK